MFTDIVIAFGSESNNAQKLAKELGTLPLLKTFELRCIALDQLELSTLSTSSLLLVITSTFGDGEPPGNAEVFQQHLEHSSELSPFSYAVFGLGDVAYPQFCQFGKWVDATLNQKGATQLINRVDADVDYDQFFAAWQQCIIEILLNKRSNGLDLELQISAYSETNPHSAKVINAKRLNQSAQGVFHIELDLTGSGIGYRSGDLLYVIPKDDIDLIERITSWYGVDVSQGSLFKNKELRILNKSLLRKLANASNNQALKDKLKIKNKVLLGEYLYGRDLIDVLVESGEPGYISIEELAESLSTANARAYSIASANEYEGGTANTVSLCIRDVSYSQRDRQYHGAASHALCHAKTGDSFSVFARANAEFHLDTNATTPIIMIGAGTGIAPYMGFIKALEHTNPKRQAMLVFGERKSQQDYLYQTQLELWQNKGVLNHLVTAFSQDQDTKYYVQHALREHGFDVFTLLENGADVFVCGSKSNLDSAIDDALIEIFRQYTDCSIDDAKTKLSGLYDNHKIHKDLY